ncbi:deubiquitinase OTUD6B-like [Oscarella lobularis]|uniref:deubiquitinase OTUD6B-like n=1 Tax=Oscarella lobularis TaxID=121494 RepID=UPI00331418EB
MEEEVLLRHREETKELRARLLAVRKAAKGDKKEKKRALAEIEKLENEMKERHERELEQLKENDDSGEKPLAQPPKQSRAQRRKERKLGEAKEREDRVLAEEEEDRKTSQRHLEREKLKELLSKGNMTIHDIAPDGDCLYSAISYQLSHEKMTYSAKELRSLAADEILYICSFSY